MRGQVITHEISACPACGARTSSDIDLGAGKHLRRCESCGLAFAPEYADPSEIYVSGYFKGETDFGLDIRHPDFQRYLLRVADERMRLIERVVRPGKLLDVGCGTGEVMAAAGKRGWKAVGVDPIEEAGTQAREQRGLDVRTSTLEESGLPERSYDVVTAFHVVEHVPAPTEFVSTLARWVRPGGHLAVEVPNFDSAIRWRDGAGWTGLRQLEHIGHFTRATLSATLVRAGLEPVSVRSPSWVGPPQSLEHALIDLSKSRYRRLFESFTHGDGDAGTPTRLGWRLLRGLDALVDRQGRGQVVFGIARVP